MNDDITQAEKRRIIKDTYFSRAQTEVGTELGGRYKHLAPAPVTGVPQYPQQPPNSPFHHDPTGAEPPLGIDVNAMPAVGTQHEVERSLPKTDPVLEAAQQARLATQLAAQLGAPIPTEGALPSKPVDRVGSSTFKRRV